MGEPILSIQDLSVHFFKDKSVVQAVNHLNLQLGVGETLGLVGETGAGKTTTAMSIMNLIPNPPGKIVGGKIMFDGEDVLKKSKRELRKMRGHDISMIFQDPMTSLNPVLTVGDQIAEVIRLHSQVSRAEASIKAQEMLEMVGISGERYGDYPHQFSGGMKQRVVIAIALACNPRLLIADEPTTALDVTIQAQVLEMIADLKHKLNTAMILITHDLGVVAQVCDKVAIMYAGEIVEYGDLSDIYEHASHPYTQGLFGSIPDLDKDTDRLNPIAGLMPDPTNLPKGCSFSPRCPHCTEACKTQDPELREISPGHTVKCLMFQNQEE
ncbi:ABC transporter ATP-binding protein [Flavonifractor sp. An100]|uniref:ABC transporter ATP-binding protein n=1 Tax=Flavonifractor sp. An100 TaxID=1965538 RepID=UPI000B3927F4|nr:ABC transporter ATP-binding protein [Flavonifractor sp. An100]OUQ77062.1 dipeptide/oligopeptide/nickel ABC transporter ATP-binding protein [Flavonifractor sp. An100]